MPSTYDPLLRLELQATGENATTWGTKTNNNLDLIAAAIAGISNITVISGDTSLTTANAAADQARSAILILDRLARQRSQSDRASFAQDLRGHSQHDGWRRRSPSSRQAARARFSPLPAMKSSSALPLLASASSVLSTPALQQSPLP